MLELRDTSNPGRDVRVSPPPEVRCLSRAAVGLGYPNHPAIALLEITNRMDPPSLAEPTGALQSHRCKLGGEKQVPGACTIEGSDSNASWPACA